jgi:hypothetical protein
LKPLYHELLATAKSILDRAEELQKTVVTEDAAEPEPWTLEAQLAVFIERTRQVCSTAHRRVLLDETVPNEVDPRNWTSAEERVLPIKED